MICRSYGLVLTSLTHGPTNTCFQNNTRGSYSTPLEGGFTTAWSACAPSNRQQGRQYILSKPKPDRKAPYAILLGKIGRQQRLSGIERSTIRVRSPSKSGGSTVIRMHLQPPLAEKASADRVHRRPLHAMVYLPRVDTTATPQSGSRIPRLKSRALFGGEHSRFFCPVSLADGTTTRRYQKTTGGKYKATIFHVYHQRRLRATNQQQLRRLPLPVAPHGSP